MENKQTAVEWLAEVTAKIGYISTDILKEAKQMEKEQISEAYRIGVEEDVYNNPLKTGEQYYNETYNQ